MTHETIKPESKEEWLSLRTKDLTSTDIPVLFNASPYSTYLETWLKKRDRLQTVFEPNDRMKWGNRLERAIAEGIAEDEGFEVYPMKDYKRIPELRLGSSFDYFIGDDGILEIKNVDFVVARDQWVDDEAPAHIELQVQHQLLVSGRKFAYIGALVSGNQTIVFRRERDEEIISAIVEKSKAFWKSIEDGIEPAPVFPEDAETIANIYGISHPGKIVEADYEVDSFAYEYQRVSEEIKRLTELKDTAKARILMRIGDAEKVISPAYTISAGNTAPKRVEAHERAGFRTFRVTFKKERAV